MKILVTGSSGFIGGYLVEEFLSHGYQVVGLDNFSKYGPVSRSFDNHPQFKQVVGDAKDVDLLKTVLSDCDHFVAGAAMIGGISYFHERAYDLIAENERIIAAEFDGAIDAFQHHRLQKITVISSSMVYENSRTFPTPEGDQLISPPPFSTYGFQKLATEYFCKGAWEQYHLPYTIVRPFNCVGIGESRALHSSEVLSGNVALAMSHVVPDLVQKILKGQNPLHILGLGDQVRHYTYGRDIAEGIRMATESPDAVNNDFNLSTDVSTTVLDLAKAIWQKVRGSTEAFAFVSDPPYAHDVQHRVPSTKKALDVLGFRANTSLDAMLDIVIPWIRSEVEAGKI